jgi:hypothetical protein
LRIPAVFVINIKPHNWESCKEDTIYGIRSDAPTPFSEGRWKLGDVCLVRVTGRDYGVRAIWYFLSEAPVKSTQEVPWNDANYKWKIQLKPLVEFKSSFSEEFEGVSKYSEKIKMNSIRLVQSVIKLTPSETKDYIQPLLKEKHSELETEADYLGSRIRAEVLLEGILKGLPSEEPAKAITEERKVRADIVGEPINFRDMVYAPLNEAGVILLFSKVMPELGIVYESSPPVFPDMVGRIRTEHGYERLFIEFEFKSSNFRTHGHPKQMQEGSPCDMIVCWENDWADSPVRVMELRSLIQELAE